MYHLELFSGTHSFGKVSSKMGFTVISLDRDINGKCPFNSGYDNSKNHIQIDIMNWNYKEFPKGFFHLITASPVCMWWSRLRPTWIGRKLKAHGDTIITKDIIEQDIEKYGIPMVDKVFEIIEYFEPKYYLIENPKTGRMKEYINDLIPYFDIDYCLFGFPYKKSTRLWTNINFNNYICNGKCKNMENGKHKKDATRDFGGGSNRLFRYRIPQDLIQKIFSNINII